MSIVIIQAYMHENLKNKLWHPSHWIHKLTQYKAVLIDFMSRIFINVANGSHLIYLNKYANMLSHFIKRSFTTFCFNC
jgi:hypothetical protein